MSLAVALLVIAQSAAPAAGANAAPARITPVAERVTVSVVVLRPARISFDINDEEETTGETRNRSIQRARDAAGTVWIEFR